MRADTHLASATGTITVDGDGVGFEVVPAVAADADGSVRAGSYPITVQVIDPHGAQVGRPLFIPNADAHHFAERFGGLRLAGCESGDSWLVRVFEHRGEGTQSKGTKTRRAATIAAAGTAVPTASPAASSDGFRIRPGTVGHTFIFGGTLTTAEVWQRSKAGNWKNTGDTIDATTETVAVRLNYAAADRIALKAAAGALTIEVEAIEEIG